MHDNQQFPLMRMSKHNPPGFLLGLLESVPEVSAKLKEPNTKDLKFEDVVKSAEQAAVLVLVY